MLNREASALGRVARWSVFGLALAALVGCEGREPPTGTVQGGAPSGSSGAGGASGPSGGAGGVAEATVGAAAGGAGGSPGGAGGAEALCLRPGELDCGDAAPCCDGSRCVTDGADVLCAATCTSGDECATGCCTDVDDIGSVCAPASFCPPAAETCRVSSDCATVCCLPIDERTSVCAPTSACATTPALACPDLVLQASDGTFLGDATSDEVAVNGVCNPIGSYGSQISPTSIFNPVGSYGSQLGEQSAYNEFSTTPPVLFCPSTASTLNLVSKNAFLTGALDPDLLCAVLAENGL
jgi:hypothetical protein